MSKNSKRANGEGSIFQRDGKYIAQLCIGKNENGKRAFKTATASTKTEAVEKLNALKEKYGTISSVEMAKAPLCTVIGKWFDDKKSPVLYQKALKSNSIDRIESIMNTHVIPAIGNIPLNEIMPEDIQGVIDSISRKGLSFSTAKKIYDYTSSLFNYAVDMEYIGKSPMKRVRLCRDKFPEAKKIEALTDDEVRALKEAATVKYGSGKLVYDCGYAIPIMIETGLRVGEILNRQERDYTAAGAKVIRASMCNWVNFSGKRYAKPVFDEMKKLLLSQNVIHADETVVQVLRESDRKAKTKSRMWVYCTDKSADKFMALFEYTRTRGGENAVKFLGDYSGYLVCDGYDAYNSLKTAKRCGCWAHARRRLVEALPNDKDLLPTSAAAKGVGYINKIYEIERNIEGLSLEEKHKQRQEQVKPLLDEFFSWLGAVDPSGRGKLSGAINYVLNEKKYLCRFLESPDISIDNNRAENSIRPFVVGRKNWMFFDSVKGAEASAMWYSLAVTACVNGLNVEEYFYRLLTSDKPVMPW